MLKLAVAGYKYLRTLKAVASVMDRLKSYYSVDFVDTEGLSEEELAEALKGYHVVIASHTPRYGPIFFERNSDVRLIIRLGIGYDNVDVDAARKAGVYVARLPNVIEAEAVAEHTIALILAALRNIVKADKAMRAGRASPGIYDDYVARELTGPANLSELTVGIVGLGHIGSRVAEILVKGFGSKVIAYDPYVERSKAEKLGVELVDSLEELVSRSDIITIHAPLTPETYHMFDSKLLSKVKPGAIIVNTARGAIVDTAALLEALRSGRVRAAALDVFEEEPLPSDHPVLKAENTVLTPHIAVFTVTTLRNMVEAAVNAAIAYAEGRDMSRYVVVVVEPEKPRPHPLRG
jgi:phosphoglycerate dehydrogenase-like enzyme